MPISDEEALAYQGPIFTPTHISEASIDEDNLRWSMEGMQMIYDIDSRVPEIGWHKRLIF